MTGPSVVVDCRWLGFSGVGRVTQLLLEGLSELKPTGDWTLWGTSVVHEYRWPGTRVVIATHSPMQWGAQRDVLSCPDGDMVIWPHAVRPFSRRRSIVLLHDLIPMHWEPGAGRRWAWRQFLGHSCRTATTLVTNSEATRTRLAEELGISAKATLTLPVDRPRADRVRSLRVDRRTESAPLLLYVGQVKPHKNLPRAVEGYLASEFCQRGGTFTIVAGGATRPQELEGIEAIRRSSTVGEIKVVSHLSDPDLDRMYASATMVIQPSLEEGYGLPVVEALAGGVPVCCSDLDALREAARGRARLFDPTSVTAIAEAIDYTSSNGPEMVAEPFDSPTTADFAGEFVRLIGLTERADHPGR
jgi:glycosyltransferase involved in cell wall biosynthesis